MPGCRNVIKGLTIYNNQHGTKNNKAAAGWFTSITSLIHVIIVYGERDQVLQNAGRFYGSKMFVVTKVEKAETTDRQTDRQTDRVRRMHTNLMLRISGKCFGPVRQSFRGTSSHILDTGINFF